MSRYYEIIDGNLHAGWASEDYMFIKMDERVLKGEANFNIHVGVRDTVDVVPVVRCKDCQFSCTPEWDSDEVFCTKNDNWFKINGYCHLGRTKDGEAD